MPHGCRREANPTTDVWWHAAVLRSRELCEMMLQDMWRANDPQAPFLRLFYIAPPGSYFPHASVLRNHGKCSCDVYLNDDPDTALISVLACGMKEDGTFLDLSLCHGKNVHNVSLHATVDLNRAPRGLMSCAHCGQRVWMKHPNFLPMSHQAFECMEHGITTRWLVMYCSSRCYASMVPELPEAQQ